MSAGRQMRKNRRGKLAMRLYMAPAEIRRRALQVRSFWSLDEFRQRARLALWFQDRLLCPIRAIKK